MLSKRKETLKTIHCRLRRLPTPFVYYSMKSVKVLAWMGEIFLIEISEVAPEISTQRSH
jgi:CII-binding regulator of phage lambda lysogenization HflD